MKHTTMLSADEEPWTGLADIFADTWMLRVGKGMAMSNIFKRKVATGRNTEDASQQVEHNDGRNADDVLNRSLRPNFLVDASAAHLCAVE
jgi:hypothetical protein